MTARHPGELTRLYLANTTANVALKVVSALVGLWATRVLVERLGAGGFGLVTLSATLSGYLALFGVGLPAGLVRRVAELRGRGEDERIRRVVRASLLLFCAIGAVAAATLAVAVAAGAVGLLSLAEGTQETARRALLATALTVAVVWPLSVFTATLTGLQKMPVLNAVRGVVAIVAAVLAVAAARAGGGPATVILVTGGVVFVGGIAQGILVHRFVPTAPAGPPPRPAREELRPLWAFGAGVLAIEIAAILIYQTDQLILGVLLSVESLTAYYVAARLHDLLREGSGILGAAVFPLIAEEHGRGNESAADQAVYRGTRYAACVVVPVTIAALLLARPFLALWMGDEYARLAPLAQAFASYWIVAVLTATAGQVALGRGESGRLGAIALVTAGINLAVSLALVRTWGIGGVIAGTLVAYALGIPAQMALVFPKLGVSGLRFVREVVAPVYPVCLPAGALWWAALRWAGAPGGAVGLAVWGASIVTTCWAALWFIAVDRRDRERILRRLGFAREGAR